jgi:hypothetical protein
MRFHLRGFLVLIGILLINSLALAQFDVGRITGTVFDPTGAVVAGATVTIKNVGTGRETTAKSDSSGTFAASSLLNGTYVVSATAKGFGTVTSATVNLNVGATVNLEMRLPLGAEKTEITVTGTTSTVQTGSTEIGNTLNNRQIENLPLNGRDIMDYIALTPGAVTTAGFGQTSLNGAELSFTGLNTLLDGADATRIDTNATVTTMGRQLSRITRASVDSIAEIRILNTGYSAEYGRSIGTVVNLITKSGTNEFHGGLFEYLRNEKLNARNFFEYTPKKQPFKLNQFGGNIGGPLIKDKLFFFANYEAVRQGITNSFITTTLSAQERAKFVSSMANVVNHLVDLPPNPGVVPGTNGKLVYYAASLITRQREDTASIKIDHMISDRDRWNFRYNVNDSDTLVPIGVNKGQIAANPARNQLIRLDYNHIFSPTMINDFGIAVNRVITHSEPGGDGIPMFSNFENTGAMPGPALFDVLSPQTSFQFLESLTKIKGAHTVKVGADIRRQRSNRWLGQQDILTYGSLADLENNQAFALTRLGYPLLGFRSTNYDFYAMDDWKVTPRFTLNLGLRYEYNSVWKEANNRVSNFDFVHQVLLPPGAPMYKGDFNNFAPRLGFSYDPFGKGKTVIRAYGGIFYLPMLMGVVNSLPANNFPNLSVTVFDIGGFGYPAPAVLPELAKRNVQTFAPTSRDSYTVQWNLNVQQEIAPQTTLEVAYSANRGIHLSAGAAFAGLTMNNIDVDTGERPYPNWGDERILGNMLSSWYHSMQVALRRRTSRFMFDVNYAWSHTIDNTVNVFGAFQDSRNIGLDWGNGDTDVRHVLTADAMYELPNLHSSSSVANKLLSGWNAGTILQARSGLPVNVMLRPGVFVADPIRPDYVVGQSIRAANYDTPDHQLNSAAFAAPAGRNGNLARNAARGPRFLQWDVSLMKNTNLSERFKLQFRSDFFNILNHPNFANPDSILANPTFGRSLSTPNNLIGFGTSRQIQFALKLLF